MASVLSSVPRGTFALHSKQLQHLRHASLSTPPLTPQAAGLGLFKPPHSIIRPWRIITGAQEWQTSTYHYNKQTQKTLPTASATADKLLRDFSTAITSRGLASTGSSGTARSAVAARRKNSERVYVSGTTAKDHGDKVVVSAFLFDAAEAEAEERKRKLAEMREKGNARRAKGGAGGAGGRRRPGMRIAVGAVGAARRPSRFGGAQKTAGAAAVARGLLRFVGAQRTAGSGRPR